MSNVVGGREPLKIFYYIIWCILPPDSLVLLPNVLYENIFVDVRNIQTCRVYLNQTDNIPRSKFSNASQNDSFAVPFTQGTKEGTLGRLEEGKRKQGQRKKSLGLNYRTVSKIMCFLECD